jgi:hypothetical protein
LSQLPQYGGWIGDRGVVGDALKGNKGKGNASVVRQNRKKHSAPRLILSYHYLHSTLTSPMIPLFVFEKP